MEDGGSGVNGRQVGGVWGCVECVGLLDGVGGGLGTEWFRALVYPLVRREVS
jgi:hypothetical protein